MNNPLSESMLVRLQRLAEGEMAESVRRELGTVMARLGYSLVYWAEPDQCTYPSRVRLFSNVNRDAQHLVSTLREATVGRVDEAVRDCESLVRLVRQWGETGWTSPREPVYLAYRIFEAAKCFIDPADNYMLAEIIASQASAAEFLKDQPLFSSAVDELQTRELASMGDARCMYRLRRCQYEAYALLTGTFSPPDTKRGAELLQAALSCLSEMSKENRDRHATPEYSLWYNLWLASTENRDSCIARECWDRLWTGFIALTQANICRDPEFCDHIQRLCAIPGAISSDQARQVREVVEQFLSRGNAADLPAGKREALQKVLEHLTTLEVVGPLNRG